MTTLVFADSHTDTETMAAVVEKVRPDAVIHLGDHIVDAILLRKRYPGVYFEMVAGNTDSDRHPSQKAIQLGEIPAFIAHGHEYRVKEGTEAVVEAGRRAGARIILYGHTHAPELTTDQGILLMNPGRIGRISSKQINASFGILRVQGEECSAEIHFVDSITDKIYVDGLFQPR